MMSNKFDRRNGAQGRVLLRVNEIPYVGQLYPVLNGGHDLRYRASTPN